MAFVVAFHTPTVGLGCRSLSSLTVAILSSISWIIQFQKRPSVIYRMVSHFANGLVILVLIAIVFFQVSVRTIIIPSQSLTI
jgi:hypothetical protein